MQSWELQELRSVWLWLLTSYLEENRKGCFVRTKSFNVLVVAATVVTLLPLAAFDTSGLVLSPFGLQLPPLVVFALSIGLGFAIYGLVWVILWVGLTRYYRKQGGESYP